MEQTKYKQYKSISITEIQEIMTNMMKDIHKVCVKHDIPYCLAYGTMLGAIRHDSFIPWDDDMDIFILRKDYPRLKKALEEELSDRYFFQTPVTDKKFGICHVPYKLRDNHSTLLEEPDRFYHQGAFIDFFMLDDYCDLENYQKVFKRCSMLSSLKMRIDFKQLSGIKKYVRILLQLIFKLVPAKAVFNYNLKQAAKLKKDDNSEYVHVGIEHMERCKFKRADMFPPVLHKFGDTEFYVPNNSDACLKELFGDYMQLPPVESRIPHASFYYNEAVFEKK